MSRKILITAVIYVFASILSGNTINPDKPYMLLLGQGKGEMSEFGGSIAIDGLAFTTWEDTPSGYLKFLWNQKDLADSSPAVKVKRSISSLFKVPNDSDHCTYSLGANDSDSQSFYFDMLSGKGNSIFNKELIRNNKIWQSCISFCHEESKSFMGIWWDSESFNGHVYIYQAENGLKTLKPDAGNPDSDTTIYDMSGDGKIILFKIEKTGSFYVYFKDKDKYQKLLEVESGHISPNGKYICAISIKDESKYLTKWILKDGSYELEKSYSNKYEFVEDSEPMISSPIISDNGDIVADLVTTKGNFSIIILNDMKSPSLLDTWIKSMPDLQWDERLLLKQIRNSVTRGISSNETGFMILIDTVDHEKNYPAKIFVPNSYR